MHHTTERCFYFLEAKFCGREFRGSWRIQVQVSTVGIRVVHHCLKAIRHKPLLTKGRSEVNGILQASYWYSYFVLLLQWQLLQELHRLIGVKFCHMNSVTTVPIYFISPFSQITATSDDSLIVQHLEYRIGLIQPSGDRLNGRCFTSHSVWTTMLKAGTVLLTVALCQGVFHHVEMSRREDTLALVPICPDSSALVPKCLTNTLALGPKH